MGRIFQFRKRNVLPRRSPNNPRYERYMLSPKWMWVLGLLAGIAMTTLVGYGLTIWPASDTVGRYALATILALSAGSIPLHSYILLRIRRLDHEIKRESAA